MVRLQRRDWSDHELIATQAQGWLCQFLIKLTVWLISRHCMNGKRMSLFFFSVYLLLSLNIGANKSSFLTPKISQFPTKMKEFDRSGGKSTQTSYSSPCSCPSAKDRNSLLLWSIVIQQITKITIENCKFCCEPWRLHYYKFGIISDCSLFTFDAIWRI